MFIGVDFDNTIVNHDAVFHKYGVERGLIKPRTNKSKLRIGRAIKKLPDGNTKWTELQGWVYGAYMSESVPMNGALEFFQECKKLDIPIAILSHRTQYPVIGPRINLRQASLQWLEDNKFFVYGLERNMVYFADTLDEKVKKIDDLGFTHFIDDLTLVLNHKKFPSHIKKYYLNKHGHANDPKIIPVKTWSELRNHILKMK